MCATARGVIQVSNWRNCLSHFSLLSLPSTPNPPSSPAHFASKRYTESIDFSVLLTITTLAAVTTTSPWLYLLIYSCLSPTPDTQQSVLHKLYIEFFYSLLMAFHCIIKSKLPIQTLLLEHHQPLWHSCKNQQSIPSLDKHSLGQAQDMVSRAQAWFQPLLSPWPMLLLFMHKQDTMHGSPGLLQPGTFKLYFPFDYCALAMLE